LINSLVTVSQSDGKKKEKKTFLKENNMGRWAYGLFDVTKTQTFSRVHITESKFRSV